jgi:hypothetical protein
MDLEPSDIIAAIGVIVALVSAVIGGGIAGFFSWLATRQLLRAEAALRKEEKEQAVNTLLCAIYHEVDAIMVPFMKGVYTYFKNLPKDQPCIDFISSIVDFPVYRGNVKDIGLIPDRLLRHSIILCYTIAESVATLCRQHNELSKEYLDIKGSTTLKQQISGEHLSLSMKKDQLLNRTKVVRDSIEKALVISDYLEKTLKPYAGESKA